MWMCSVYLVCCLFGEGVYWEIDEVGWDYFDEVY